MDKVIQVQRGTCSKSIKTSTHLFLTQKSKLRNKLKELVQLCFIKNNDQSRYNYLILGKNKSGIVKSHCDSTITFSETDIIKMPEFLIDNVYCCLVDVFFKTIDIHMDTNCAPLLIDLFLYRYEAYFIQELLNENEKKITRSFNFTFRYICPFTKY